MKVKKYLKEEDILHEDGPKINLKKYGFVRAPEEDFFDDGSRFTCYWYDPDNTGDKRFRTSYTRWDDNVYISVRFNNDKTGKTEYFDDLNGVSVQEAIDGLPDLVEKLEDHKAKMKDYTAYEFTDEQKKAFFDEVDEVIRAYKRLGTDKLNQYKIVEVALKNLGIDEEDVKQQDLYELQNKVYAILRNEKTYSEDIIKEIAKEALQNVLKTVRGTPGGYNYRGKWLNGTEAKSLDYALRTISAFAKDGSNYIGFHELPDKDQERIIRWIRKKVEPILDDTFDENMTEAVDMSYINKNMEIGEDKTVVAADPAYVAAQETEKKLEDNMDKVMKDKADDVEDLELREPETKDAGVDNMYTDKIELSESLFEDASDRSSYYLLQDDGEEDMWTKVFNELCGEMNRQWTHRELKGGSKKRYPLDRVFTVNDSDIAVDVADEQDAAFAKKVAEHYGCRYEIKKSPQVSAHSKAFPYQVIIYTSEFMDEGLDENELEEGGLIGNLISGVGGAVQNVADGLTGAVKNIGDALPL